MANTVLGYPIHCCLVHLKCVLHVVNINKVLAQYFNQQMEKFGCSNGKLFSTSDFFLHWRSSRKDTQHMDECCIIYSLSMKFCVFAHNWKEWKNAGYVLSQWTIQTKVCLCVCVWGGGLFCWGCCSILFRTCMFICPPHNKSSLPTACGCSSNLFSSPVMVWNVLLVQALYCGKGMEKPDLMHYRWHINS